MSEITVFVFFCVSLLRIMLSRSTQVIANGKVLSFLSMSSIPLPIWARSSSSLHLSVDTEIVSMPL